MNLGEILKNKIYRIAKEADKSLYVNKQINYLENSKDIDYQGTRKHAKDHKYNNNDTAVNIYENFGKLKENLRNGTIFTENEKDAISKSKDDKNIDTFKKIVDKHVEEMKKMLIEAKEFRERLKFRKNSQKLKKIRIHITKKSVIILKSMIMIMIMIL